MASKVANTSYSLIVHAGLASLAVVLSTSTIMSVASAQVPTSVQPGQLEKRFERDGAASAPSNIQAPVVTPAPALSKEVQDRLSKQRFILKGVSVEGSTVYGTDAFQSLYADKVGKQVSMLDAQSIARQITDRYRGDGYILSQATVQSNAGGMLKIRVSEGYISNVVIQGDARDSYRNLLQHYGQNLTEKRPVTLADMERYMLLMDDLPGATAKGVVRPSRTQPGSAELVVDMAHKPFEASYTINNRGSKFVGPIQHSAIFSANSLFNMYDRTTLRLITTSPTTELRFIDLQHEQQISDEGTRLVLTGSFSHSEPGDSLKPTDIRGDSYFVQAKVLHPFLRSRQENLTGRFVVDARNSETDVFAVVDSSKDRLRVARAGVAYDFADSLAGVNLIDFEVSHGFNIFNASGKTGVLPARTNGEADFTKVGLDITRTQALPNNFSIFAAAASQYSFDRLLPAEQFTLGGPSFGQAYDPGELSGDHGIAGKLELRYGQGLGDPLLQSYQVYGFYDIGRTWLRNAGAGGNDKKSLASAGFGVRTNFSEHLVGDFQVAKPLTKEASNQGADDGKHPRIFFNVTGRF